MDSSSQNRSCNFRPRPRWWRSRRSRVQVAVPPTRLLTECTQLCIMDRPREVNIRTLLNARTDLSSPRTTPAAPCVCDTTSEGARSSYLSPTSSTPELFENSCPIPPPLLHVCLFCFSAFHHFIGKFLRHDQDDRW